MIWIIGNEKIPTDIDFDDKQQKVSEPIKVKISSNEMEDLTVNNHEASPEGEMTSSKQKLDSNLSCQYQYRVSHIYWLTLT